METIKIITKVAFLTALIFVTYSNSQFQTINSDQNSIEVKVQSAAKYVSKKDGWTIPNATFPNNGNITHESLDGTIFIRKTLALNNLQLIDFEHYFIVSPENIEITHESCEIRNVATFEIDSKIFAYFVGCSPTEISNGSLSSAGAIYSFYLIDSDGDGKFDQRVISRKLPYIPDWVKSHRN